MPANCIPCNAMHTTSTLSHTNNQPPLSLSLWLQLPEFQADFLRERRKYHERQAKIEKLQQQLLAQQQQQQARR